VENDTFFHLLVKPAAPDAAPIELLVSDLAGETYPEAVATLSFCQGLQALVRADHLVLFLDSKSLTNDSKKHAECDNARSFLQRVLAAIHKPKSLHVHVVFSRWDFITRDAKRGTFEAYCNDFEADLVRRFGDSFASLQFLKIAARPEAASPTRQDVQILFGRCPMLPMTKLSACPCSSPVAQATERQAERFQVYIVKTGGLLRGFVEDIKCIVPVGR
jgi:hypothetical protein